MSGVDLDVDNYTISELLGILELEDPTSEEIIDESNKYITRFSPLNENRPDLVVFFQDIQTRLLRYMNELENGENNEYTADDEQTEKWITKQVLPQDDPIQKNKITGRIQKIDVYDNNHLPMKREQIGINNTFEVPVAQDSLNPNLQNVTSRFIVLDSQFRQAAGGSESMSTDYTLDLSESLTDVVTLSLYSIQIPYTWYKIDYIYGNTCFWLTNEGNTFKIFIEPGNYTASEFCITLTNSFKNIGFTYPASPNPDIVRYNSNNGKITLYLDGWDDPNGNEIKGIIQYTDTFNSETNPYYTFFDITGGKSCYESGTYPCSASASSGRTFDSTLGWLMGFNLPIQPVFSSTISGVTYSGGNTPQNVLNLIGTKYFTLVIDDFNQNRINNGLITITELSKNLPLPSYYNNSQPYICGLNVPSLPSILDITAIGNLSNITQEEAVSMGVNPSNLFNSLQDKLDIGSGSVQQILPSAPRTLTQAQIYTVNEIIKNRSKTISFRSKAPTNADTFGIIPLKYGSLITGQLYSELSGQFQDNKRIYFGPVDIDRLRITLLDDRGNVVDLHGADWSVTLISENLYQY
jgi:hypothetical protein